MLQLSEQLQHIPVLSLRTGSPVAETIGPVINPTNLKVEGFYCYDLYSKKTLILVTQDIREQLPQGFVINDQEVLVQPQELIRLEKILKLKFELINKNVKTVSQEKIGKVTDYATDFESFYIHKLYVSQSIVKSFTGGSLVVDRNQINEITNKYIVIEDLLQPTSAQAVATNL